MTLINDSDLDILKLYTCIGKVKFLRQGCRKLEHEQDRQTDKYTDRPTERIISRVRRR